MAETGRRRRRLLALAALLLAAGIAGSSLLALPPREELAEALLSRMFGLRVEIGALELRLEAGVELELRELRARAQDAAGDEPAAFEVRRAVGRQSWPRLLTGQLFPRRWELEGPVVRLSGTTPGSAPPPVPELDLSVVDGRVEWRRGGASEPLELRGLRVEAQRGKLWGSASGHLAGNLFQGGVLVTALRLNFEGWLDRAVLRGDLRRLDLSRLSPGAVELRGSASGDFEIEHSPERLRVTTVLEVEGPEFRPPGFESPLRAERSLLRLGVDWSRPLLEIGLDRLTLDDLDLRGRVSVDFAEDGRILGDLTIAPFVPGPSARLHPLSALGTRFAIWDRINRRISGGRVGEVGLRWDVPRAQAAETFAFRRESTPDELEIELALSGATFRPFDDAPPLEQVSGQVRISGDVLKISGAGFVSGGSASPRIALRLAGMRRLCHLPREERRIEVQPGVPLPGLARLFAGFAPRAEEGSAAGVRLAFDKLEMQHPYAVLPVRGATGELVYADGALSLRAPEAVLGGAPASLAVDWNRQSGELRLDVAYLPGEASPRPEPAEEWLRGRLEMPRLPLGKLLLEDPSGWVHARGARAELRRIEGLLAGGEAAGSGWLSLAEEGGVPYEFQLRVEGADASAAAPAFGLDPANLTGRLSASGKLGGRLGSGAPYARHAEVDLRLNATEGTLGGLPWVMAIARLPSIQGARALLGRPLLFDTLDTHLRLAQGRMDLTELNLKGPELRGVADARIELTQPGAPTDALVTLMFLNTVDRVLGSVPVVNVLLGKDGNLLATSFRIRGPRENLSVTYVPPGAVQAVTGVIGQSARSLFGLIRKAAGGGKDDGDEDSGTGEATRPDAP
ncbi:MAG: hypothetical protein J4G09_00820 [Proteobacteria bacterium]|nr:hypothetical protein [Pseudomonadota bacterium]